LATKHLAHFGPGFRAQVLVSVARSICVEASSGALNYDAVPQRRSRGYAGVTAARNADDGDGTSLRDPAANRASVGFHGRGA
jgi:hypothetical protein